MKQPLTERMISEGARLLRLLDESKIRIKTAFWLYSSDRNSWWLYLAMPHVEKEGQTKAYKIIQTVILKSGDEKLRYMFENISVIDTKDRLVKIIKDDAQTRQEPTDYTLTFRYSDGIFIEDAYVYRAA